MELGVSAPERRGEVKLSDGRALGYAEWGPRDGTPVLFFSGAAMGSRLGFGTHLLDEARVRLIAVDRPGLGASDPRPDRTLADWPSDVAALTRALELPPFGVVGFSQGAPFALACAAAGLPGAVAVVSGQDDLRHPGFAGALASDVAGMLDAVTADQAAFETSFAQSAGPELLWKIAIDASSPVDQAVYRDEAFAAAYRESLEEGFRQGAAGYARDLALALSPWPFTVESISVPVDLWYGGHDVSIVHSPDHGATMTTRIPGARRHLLSEAGGSLLWTHAGEILRTLLSRLSGGR
ncbi:alpha/beta fold hydrolase [Thermostaphylospora chromogena]|uniref:Pimeloyl-ACP methyl ester carboxylesterase n=1 Tax=Thermostaphylospora chromogena TaxID=35622 RepID=A0A1H1BZX2_9ACTN|nr:alpha/beta hydrolase [Thermostaphylospora chromogena]SDQ57484.1 Pimeloyl-ACP methyl ester carboxylesterase [Thermostaphylospora chromogena]